MNSLATFLAAALVLFAFGQALARPALGTEIDLPHASANFRPVAQQE